MKIVIFDVEPWECETFGALEKDHNVAFEEGQLDAESAETHRDANLISAFIYSDFSGEVLKKFDDLRFIATRSTGFDHIDMDWCRENDVTISNVPTYGKNTVAEHVFALLLAISHRIVEAVDRTRRGDFTQGGLQGFDLQGRTMGLIGTGDIGAHTARIARGFGMEVLAFDVEPREDVARELGFSYVPGDLRLVRAGNLRVNESALTGESVPQGKTTDAIEGEVELAERENAAFKGTSISNGSGIGVVVATGMDTELGHISRLADEAEEEETPPVRTLSTAGDLPTSGGSRDKQRRLAEV